MVPWLWAAVFPHGCFLGTCIINPHNKESPRSQCRRIFKEANEDTQQQLKFRSCLCHTTWFSWWHREDGIWPSVCSEVAKERFQVHAVLFQDGCENQSMKKFCSPPLLPWKIKIHIKQEGESHWDYGAETEPKSLENLIIEPWQLPYKQYSREAPDAKSMDINEFFYTEQCQFPDFFFLEGCIKIGLEFNYFYSYYSFLTHFLSLSPYEKPHNHLQNLPKIWTKKLTQWCDLI